MRDSSDSNDPDDRGGTAAAERAGGRDGEDRDREVFRRGHAPGTEPRVADPDGDDAGSRSIDGEGGNVAGASPGSVQLPVEPGSPSLEHTLFVLLGVVLTLFVFVRLAGV